NLKLLELFQKTAAELGQELGVSYSGGGSDANFAAAIGTPVVDGVGPVGGGHHSAEEYLNIPSMFFRIDLLARCLKKFTES
ncbi:MAG TPA: M20/M25/M40 family metallo-hydrolase, partial [Bacillota bacterium]|nr:M20/M25/M40 family metallo-hydrolase [Bacillota bacterium]